MKAIVLFSGGLDSILAAHMLKAQGVEVVGLNMITPFHDCSAEARQRANEIGIELVVREFGEDYMHMLAHPKWGYGSNVNPCLECRTMMCQEASKLMEEIGADFVATGEVVGQRPNSQMMHQLSVVARESGLQGKLLRPLSAKVLPRTEMEIDGDLDREKMRSFSGRSRVKLSAFARREFNVKRIPQPSTGCVLCENSFAPRVRDLLKYKENPTVWDAKILPWGRLLRIDADALAVVARREQDCDALDKLFASDRRSRCVLLYPDNYNGASALLVTDFAPEFGARDAEISERLNDYIQLTGSLMLRFSNPLKYRATAEGPRARLYIGAETRYIPLHEDPRADDVPIVKEKEKGEKDQETQISSDESQRADAPEDVAPSEE